VNIFHLSFEKDDSIIIAQQIILSHTDLYQRKRFNSLPYYTPQPVSQVRATVVAVSSIFLLRLYHP